MALVQVLNNFKSIVDGDKLLKFIIGETKNSKGMKSADSNNNMIGRMTALGACIESKLYLQ